MKIQLNKVITGGGLFLLMISIFLLVGCQNASTPEPLRTAQDYLDKALISVDSDKLAADLAIIDDSLAMWGLTGVILTEPHGVRYKIDTMGTGVEPVLENTIRIKYSGRILTTGVEFDASNGIDFNLSLLIIGFQTAFPLLPKGTVGTLYIPSGYGYGPQAVLDNTGNVVIPGNSNLIFDFKLIDVY